MRSEPNISLDAFAAQLLPFLEGSVQLQGLSGLGPESRWQALRSLPVWLKREDELGFPSNGPKFRKLLSLGRALKGSEGVLSWGSSRSAFLFGLVQLCRSLGLPCEIYLLKATPWSDQAVDVSFARLFQGAVLHWIDREEWQQVSARVDERRRAKGSEGWIVIPEGGDSPLSLPGALTLPLEIARQSHRLAIPLQTLWTDAGTGLTAQSLILGLGTVLATPPRVEVLLCAGNEAGFRLGLEKRLREASALLPDLNWQMAPYVCRHPPTARSFGSSNRQVWQQVEDLLAIEGLLVDPIYNAKLFLNYAAVRKVEPAQGPELLIHSGGALSNFAFGSARFLS